jgi:hypothetical protein
VAKSKGKSIVSAKELARMRNEVNRDFGLKKCKKVKGW